MAKDLDSTAKVVTAGQDGHNRVEVQDSGGNVISQTKVNENDKYGSKSQIVHSTHDSTGQTSHTTIHGNDHVNKHNNSGFVGQHYLKIGCICPIFLLIYYIYYAHIYS